MSAEDELAEREREASVARIEAGGLPLNAERRMRELAEREGSLFTSDLSVSEWALGHRLGVRPLAQVMGSCVHQVGYQVLPGAWGGDRVFCELDTITAAWNEARSRAFGRLAEEARLIGADAVIGVHVRRGAHDWAAGAVDYVVVGTAVRTAGTGPPPPHPALSDLSVQDYYKLHEAGYAPAGVVAATTVFFVSPSWQTSRLQSMTFTSNQELPDYTQGLYAARGTLLARLTSQANAQGAEGIVGVTIDQHARMGDFATGFGASSRGGLAITLHGLGTGIRTARQAPPLSPQPTYNLGG